MLKHKRIVATCMAVLLIVALFTGFLAFGVFEPEEVMAALGPSTIVYNMYATDGYWQMADGTSIYSYGFVGGREGQPLTYLDGTGAPVTIPGGAPPPTAGPIVPGSIEAQLLGNAQFPAPIIYATTGDVVEIRLKNLGVANPIAPNDPHTIHLHAVDTDAANDGVPETSLATIPANSGLPGAGNVVVYMFTAPFPGTYMYHCHQEADIHVTMGMYGAMVIYNPTDPAALVGPGVGAGGNLFGFHYDKDYVMLLTDTDTRQHDSEAGTGPAFNPVDYKPQYWFINGLSFPNTIHATLPGTTFNWNNWITAHPGYDPFITGAAGAGGQKVLVRMINLGFETQPMHIHGFHPKVIGGDQRPWDWASPAGSATGTGLEKNTFTVGSGETYELLIDFSTQEVAGYYPGPSGPPSSFAGGVQSRYDIATNMPVSNNLTANPEIPDLAGDPYIGGPKVTGLVGFPDPTSQYFPWHNHDDYKSTNNGVYPGGQFTMVRTDLGAPPPTAPLPPSNLMANAVSPSQIDLSWTDTSNNEDGFVIERKTGVNGVYAQIATLGPNTTTFSDTNLIPSTTYFYRVQSFNLGGNLGYSNEAFATTLAPPAVTFGLNAGTNVYNETNNDLNAMRFLNNAATGTLTTIEMLFQDTTPNGLVRLGVYADNAGVPGALVLDAGQVAVANGWVSISGLNLPVTLNTYYWLSFNLQSPNGVTYQTGQAAQSHRWAPSAFGPLPATYPGTSASSANQFVMRATVQP